jgi:hypothetical protein
MNLAISEDNGKLFAFELKKIYGEIIFEENESFNNLQIIKDIISSVEENSEFDKSYFQSNPNYSFAFDSYDDLIRRFLQKNNDKIEEIITTISEINNIFSNTADLLIITVPYVLFRFGVNNQDILFFIGFGIALSKIIVDWVSQIKDKNKKSLISVKENLKQLNQITLDYLNDIDQSKMTNELKEYKEKIMLYMESLDK